LLFSPVLSCAVSLHFHVQSIRRRQAPRSWAFSNRWLHQVLTQGSQLSNKYLSIGCSKFCHLSQETFTPYTTFINTQSFLHVIVRVLSHIRFPEQIFDPNRPFTGFLRTINWRNPLRVPAVLHWPQVEVGMGINDSLVQGYPSEQCKQHILVNY
jgi:hypothetical protein